MVVTRVILAWAALSLAAGAEVLYVEMGRVSQTALALAANHTECFIEHIEAIGPEHLRAQYQHRGDVDDEPSQQRGQSDAVQ